jgi:hypothetical protein
MYRSYHWAWYASCSCYVHHLTPLQEINQDAVAIASPPADSLAARLSIPPHLLTHTTHPTLHVAYERYKGCLDAQERLTTLIANGEWSGKVPILEDVISLFVLRSTWYDYYVKAFNKLDQFPDLHEYLERTPHAPLAKDLFRLQKSTYTYMDIFDYRARYGREQERERRDNRGEGSSKRTKVDSRPKVVSKRKPSHRL